MTPFVVRQGSCLTTSGVMFHSKGSHVTCSCFAITLFAPILGKYHHGDTNITMCIHMNESCLATMIKISKYYW